LERTEKFLILGLTAISGFLLYVTREFKLPAATGYKVGDDLWPKIVLVGLLIMLVSSLVFGWKKQAEVRVREPNASGIRCLVIISMSLVYAYILQYVGFLVLTPFFIGAFACILGLRKILPLAGLSVLLTAFFFFVFRIVLSVPLPLGLWYFKKFSLLFCGW